MIIFITFETGWSPEDGPKEKLAQVKKDFSTESSLYKRVPRLPYNTVHGGIPRQQSGNAQRLFLL